MSDTYSIDVTIRTKDGKMPKDEDGNAVPRIQLKREIKKGNAKAALTRIFKDFNALLPEHDINIEASVHNSISNTYMTMHSFYGSQRLFINH